ncbi:kinase-like domain-containing protein [Mycena rosella]|uniref:Kinase-like domain-containing protein n=1 Tax=Mycena rosella TaxID=1033263 RepID=A0AAD7CPM3_MYCRO|nr:kinase-like domain-containing protein [Mycena rosella]
MRLVRPSSPLELSIPYFAQQFCREALVWHHLQHPFILPLIGIDRETFPPSICMVSPWMEHGTILKYLKDYGRANVDRLLSEVAQGMQYLHSRKIVHGDLRGANILITPEWSACLADFGLTSFSDATATHTSTRAGSLRWMAPELIHPGHFGKRFVRRTPATDVYAFACVCLELYTGRPPFADFSETVTLLTVINGDRPDRPSGEPAMSEALWQHVNECWAQDSALRPATDSVVYQMGLNYVSWLAAQFTETSHFPLDPEGNDDSGLEWKFEDTEKSTQLLGTSAVIDTPPVPPPPQDLSEPEDSGGMANTILESLWTETGDPDEDWTTDILGTTTPDGEIMNRLRLLVRNDDPKTIYAVIKTVAWTCVNRFPMSNSDLHCNFQPFARDYIFG